MINDKYLRIAIDCRALGKKRTGDEVYTKNLVTNLANIDNKNQYFLLFDKEAKIQELGFSLPSNFKTVTILPSYKLLWTMYSLPKWLRKNKVDVLHVQYITPFWLPRDVKLITTIHDVSWKFYPQHIKKSDLFFLNILIPTSLNKANKIITVSQTSKDDIVKIFKISPDKIAMIYNGVDNIVGHAMSDNVIKKYNLPKKFIFYVGTLQPRKNIPALLETFNILNTKYQVLDTKLVIAGGKGHNYDQRIDTLVEKYKLQDKVLFPGFVDEKDLPTMYKLANVFVFPSLYEGFGIPVIEAMAMGAPVIVSNKSCLPEVVGRAGLIIDPEDSIEFAKTIYDLISNEKLRNNLIEKGHKRAKEFSWNKMAEETLKLYYSI